MPKFKRWQRLRRFGVAVEATLLVAISAIVLGLLPDALTGNAPTNFLNFRLELSPRVAIYVFLLFILLGFAVWRLDRIWQRPLYAELRLPPKQEYTHIFVPVSNPHQTTVTYDETTSQLVVTTGQKTARLTSLKDACKDDPWTDWPFDDTGSQRRGPNTQQFLHVVNAALQQSSSLSENMRFVLLPTVKSRNVAGEYAKYLSDRRIQVEVYSKDLEPYELKHNTDLLFDALPKTDGRDPVKSLVDVTGGTSAISVGLGLAGLDFGAVIMYVTELNEPKLFDVRHLPAAWARS